MTIKFGEKNYITDNDLKVNILGFWPGADIKNEKLKEFFEKNYRRSFLGGDELVAYAQSLVSHGMEFSKLEEEILGDIENPENKDFRNILFSKTATGIGSGHSLGGLSGVVLGIHGTKMVDSALTGLCASRSLVTSSRRRETTAGEIAIPEKLGKNSDLLKEYMQISENVLNLSNEFKEKFGKLGGVETFNKVIPYNNPADLFIVLPLDTLSTIVSEVRKDESVVNGVRFVPREIYTLVKEHLESIEENKGQNVMFKQRIEVPRDTYLHYTVFKSPFYPNYALEEGELRGMPLEPVVIDIFKDITPGFRRGLERLSEIFNTAKRETNPEQLAKFAKLATYELRVFTNEYNEAVRVKIADSLSWRVWSEQKRHSTLRQNVESVYSAAERASDAMKKFWSFIEKANETQNLEELAPVLGEIEKSIILDDRLKRQKELIIPYLYHTGKQLEFYRKLKNKNFELRDCLYIVPKNIRVRTLENYDLINLINLEFPLRLCGKCEPERQVTSWKKREKLIEVVPEIAGFLQPKCNVGYCTERTICKYMKDVREDYNEDLHKAVKEAVLNKSR